MSGAEFGDLMDLPPGSCSLQTVDLIATESARDAKDTLGQEVLQQSKKKGSYFTILEEAFEGESFVEAKYGHVILCGGPRAGKIELRDTMMRIMDKKKSRDGRLDQLKFGEFRSEVEFCEIEDATIGIWDFPHLNIFEQWERRMFSLINQSCIFVYVFNPFQGVGMEDRNFTHKFQDTFAQDLRSWLQLMVSTRRTPYFIQPKIMIIITHKDEWRETLINEVKLDLMLQKLENIVEELRYKLRDVVDLSPRRVGSKTGSYHINAQDKRDVLPVTRDVVSSLRDILKHKSPKVPRACSELVSEFLSKPELERKPVLTLETFYNYCSKVHPLLQKSKLGYERQEEVLHAIAAYMHDAGTICMTQNALSDCNDGGRENSKKLLGVDLRWLASTFLRPLHFSSHSLYDIDELSDFITNILDRFIYGRRNPFRIDVEGVNTIVKVLVEVGLCYSFESYKGTTRYFMPTIVREAERRGIMKLYWNVDPLEESDHLGYRVQCQDKERTSLSTTFFPRYQIHLREEMGAHFGITDEKFIFSYSYAEIILSDCHIFVEIDRSTGNHLDIMVQFSKHRTRDWAIEFIQQYIIQDILHFCASKHGCPGMQLVVAILRTECVKRLTPQEFRTEDQAVLVEELKSRFQYDIESQLQSGKVGYEVYGHSWPAITGVSRESQISLPPGREVATCLLSSEDLKDILTAVPSHNQELWRKLEELRGVSARLEVESSNLPEVFRRPVAVRRSSSKQPRVDSCAIRARSQIITSDLSGEKLILHHMKANMPSFVQLRKAFDKLHSEMLQVRTRVDTIIGYGKSNEDHRLPRRPYFSRDDVRMIHRVKAKFLSAPAMRLHLMCESIYEPHFVKDQPGLELCLEKDCTFAEWMETLSVVSLKMIWVLLKIGVEVTRGFGSIIPNISNLATEGSVGICGGRVDAVLEELKEEVDKNLSLMKDRRLVNEAWSGLRNYLAEYLTPENRVENCARMFRLHLVRYRNSQDLYVWLCEPCMVSARRDFLLD